MTINAVSAIISQLVSSSRLRISYKSTCKDFNAGKAESQQNFFNKLNGLFSNETTTHFYSLFEKRPYHTNLYNNPLIDELGLFFYVLEGNKNQTDLIKQNLLLNNSTNEIKITICLTVQITFILVVLDSFEDAIVTLPTPTLSSLSEFDIESPAPILVSKTKIEKPIINKNLDLSEQKQSKFEENIQNALETIARRSRGSFISSSMNMSNNSNETSSQRDLNDELDTDINATIFNNDFLKKNNNKKK
ncbi:unnamed protein product [Rotaria sp. Silwood2]|nr:unnamed protein product [Rotaria sp. Silwood2]